MLVFRTATRTGEVYLDPQVIVGIVELKNTGTTLYISGGQTIDVDATARGDPRSDERRARRTR